jgi:hypothetical protein
MTLMKTFASRGPLVAVLSFALGTLTCASEQPKIKCQTAHGGFSVKYTLKTGTGECAMLKGGVVGVHTYARAPGDTKDWANWEKPPIAIRPDEVGVLLDEYGTELDPKVLFARGEFTDDIPPADGFCRVGTMNPITMKLPETQPPTMMGMPPPAKLPAKDLSYEWSNVKFFVSPSVIGTQFAADLKYTLNGCVATYTVIGLYPSVGCEKTMTVTGADGKPVTMGTGMPDEDSCYPCAQVEKGHATGSGIVPDIDVSCDPQVLLCLPKNALPSLRSLQCPLQ